MKTFVRYSALSKQGVPGRRSQGALMCSMCPGKAVYVVVGIYAQGACRACIEISVTARLPNFFRAIPDWLMRAF